MRRFLLALLLSLYPTVVSAQIADIVSATGAGSGSASFSVNLTGTVDNACLVGIGKSTGSSTVTACTVGGVNCTHVPNADAGNGGVTTLFYSVPLGTTTGSQTVSVSVSLGRVGVRALCASHVNQSTLTANGTNQFTVSSGGTDSLAITSAVNHLTVDFVFAGDTGALVSSPTQTLVGFTDLGGGTGCPAGNNCMGMSRAAGSASNTHSWTITAGSTVYHSGVDLLPAEGGAPAPRPCLLQFLGIGRCDD